MTVPTALQARMCKTTLPIRLKGGLIQLFSSPQSWAKALTASVPGQKNLLLNLGHWALTADANQSIVWISHRWSSTLKNLGFSFQSSASWNLDNLSAKMLFSLGVHLDIQLDRLATAEVEDPHNHPVDMWLSAATQPDISSG